MYASKASGTLRHAERGGVAAIVAMLLGMGVLLGMGALTVDVGNIMWERRQLQNGADAASLALASACATDDASCTASNALIEKFNDLNAADGASSNDGVCGRHTPVGVPVTCTSAGDNATQQATKLANLGECPPLPSWLTGAGADLPYVEVKTGTLTKTNASFLPAFLSRAITGSDIPHYAACARAAWGPIGRSIPTLPIVFAACDWTEATKNGFAPSPPYDPAPGNSSTALPPLTPGKVTPIVAHLDSSAKPTEDSITKCLASNNPGKYYAGGFGWVQTCEKQGWPSPACDNVSHSDTCTAVFDATGTVLVGDNGASAPKGCKKEELASYVGTEVWIPIMTKVNVDSQGKATGYVIDGISSFFLAGYNDIPSASPKTTAVYSGNPCGKGDCLWGWFTGPVVPTGSMGTGGTPRGPVLVKPAG